MVSRAQHRANSRGVFHARTALTARAVLVALFLVATGTAVSAQLAAPPPAPPLPPPSGPTVSVSSVSELEAAVDALTSGTTILVQPGIYQLDETLIITNGVTRVSIRGATGNRDDVIILGSGMETEGVDIGIKVDLAQDVEIANLSVGQTFWHPIQLQGEEGAARVHVYNVHLFDSGEQLLKSTVDPTNPQGVDDVTVEYSVIEYTDMGPSDGYTQGIDVHDGANWVIRYNLFRNIRVPPTADYVNQPAILMWSGSHDTQVYANTIINCERGIIFGQGPQDPYPHSHWGGIIVNNMIYRTDTVNADAGISLWDSPDTKVYHNTVIQNGTYPDAIEYRFPSTTGVQIVNNLTDGNITARDGADATVLSNITDADSSMFLNAAAGDLHLLPTAIRAIGQGSELDEVTVDWDGDPRPSPVGWDIGADEVWIQPPASSSRVNHH